MYFNCNNKLNFKMEKRKRKIDGNNLDKLSFRFKMEGNFFRGVFASLYQEHLTVKLSQIKKVFP